MKKVFQIMLLVSFLYLIASNMNMRIKNEQEVAAVKLELQQAEDKIETYKEHIWMLNLQRGEAMRAYDQLLNK